MKCVFSIFKDVEKSPPLILQTVEKSPMGVASKTAIGKGIWWAIIGQIYCTLMQSVFYVVNAIESLKHVSFHYTQEKF